MVCRGFVLGLLGVLVLSGSIWADSPGDTVGTTYYDYQTNGSTGNRIGVHDCGVHMCWLNGVGTWSGNRWIYYNYMDPDGNFGWSEGVCISEVQGAGFTNLDYDASGNAMIIYTNPLLSGIELVVDSDCGHGSGTHYNVLNGFYWPYIACDNNDNIHVVCQGNESPHNPQVAVHIYSTDGGATWTGFSLFDRLMNLSNIIVASPVDDKVAIVYTKHLPAPDSNQYNNNVVYIESEDGVTWNYTDIRYITDYQWEDTIRAYCDVDAVYDNDGNLHVVWNASGYFADQGAIFTDKCFLYHWSESSGISMVHNAWHWSVPGAWNRSASKMSIGVDAYNNLYYLWTHFDTLDISAGGLSNGELYMAYSEDGGVTWSDAENITNSPSPNCQPGNCDSDHWSSLAEVVDEHLHVFYVNDKDAGGIPQSEGLETENPMLYLRYPNPLLVGVEDDEPTLPTKITLHQNHPNPFNSTTTIRYSLTNGSDVQIDIYNLLGQKVKTLINSRMDAGKHSVTWEASRMASGIYFYKLTIGDKVFTKRMTLLK